jgi:hypothetical protein
MKPKPVFDVEFAVPSRRPFRPIRSIGQFMIVVALSGLVMVFVPARSRRLPPPKGPARAPVVPAVFYGQLAGGNPHEFRLWAYRARAQERARRIQDVAVQRQPREPFVVVAPGWIDPQMVVRAPDWIDPRMVVNPDGRMRAPVRVAPSPDDRRVPDPQDQYWRTPHPDDEAPPSWVIPEPEQRKPR